MTWFRVDDAIGTHPKIKRIPRRLRAAAVGVWVLAGAWSAAHLQDGFVPGYMIEDWTDDEEIPAALVAAGLWRQHRDGYKFHDWADYNPTRAQVEERRAADAERKAAARARAASNRRNSGARPGGQGADSAWDTAGTPSGQSAESALPDPTRPDPTHREEEPIGSSLSASEPADLLPPVDGEETLLPDEWRPQQSHVDKARSLHLDPVREYQRFRAHAERTQRRQKSWNAAFTNWLRKTAEFNTQQQGRLAPAAPQQQSKAARNAAEYRRIFGGDQGSVPALDAGLGA